jgi:NAD(P)H-nitrite reductase large subunit
MLYILRLAASTFQQSINIVFHFLTGNCFRQIHDPSLGCHTMKHIVILGGSHAGISTAHRILKRTEKTSPFKITLVSPNTHLYWNLASPRGIIPGQLTDEKLFQPIAAGFQQYPASQFEFILAAADSLDVEAKQVGISSSSGKAILGYDFLVISTGSNTKGNTPFKGLGSTEATKDALHEFQVRVKNAKTVVIAGAGVTGIEAAGELGFEYGRQKEIILVSLRCLEIRHNAAAFLLQYCLNVLIRIRSEVGKQSSREPRQVYRRSQRRNSRIWRLISN